MLFDGKRQKLVDAIGPAVESVTGSMAAVIALSIVAIVVSVIALAISAKVANNVG